MKQPVICTSPTLLSILCGIAQECGRLFLQHSAYVTVEKATRKAIQEPHNLANWARRTGTSFRGTMGEVSEMNFTIQATLNQEDFQVQY